MREWSNPMFIRDEHLKNDFIRFLNSDEAKDLRFFQALNAFIGKGKLQFVDDNGETADLFHVDEEKFYEEIQAMSKHYLVEKGFKFRGDERKEPSGFIVGEYRLKKTLNPPEGTIPAGTIFHFSGGVGEPDDYSYEVIEESVRDFSEWFEEVGDEKG